MRKSDFEGPWRIIDMELWDAEARDLVGPAFIEFGSDRIGRFGFVAVEGAIDYRLGERAGRPIVEFSWQGSDDRHEATGRGWAMIEEAGGLAGRIYFHMGDDSSFTAVRQAVSRAAVRVRSKPPRR